MKMEVAFNSFDLDCFPRNCKLIVDWLSLLTSSHKPIP